MRHMYDLDAVRQFLTENGAQHLPDNDPVLPHECRGTESWLMPCAWKNCAQVLVNFPEHYPDCSPKLYWPSNIPREKLIPHINRQGNICVREDHVVVNPFDPIAELQDVLKKGQKIVETDLSEEEILAEVEDELAAYCSGENYLIHFLPEHLATEMCVLKKAKGKLWETVDFPRQISLSQFDGFGICLGLDQPQILSFIRAPQTHLLNSSEIRSRLVDASNFISDRAGSSKAIELFLVLSIVTKKGVVRVWAELGKLRIKRKSPEELLVNLLEAINTSFHFCLGSEDLSTNRLMRRSKGSTFKEDTLKQRVAIVGCGSLGGFLSDHLARSGVSNLLLIDKGMLEPSNLARHLLDREFLYKFKARGLCEKIKSRFIDSNAIACSADFRSNEAQQALKEFHPDLVVFVTGDTNTDLTAANAALQEKKYPRCFMWIEGAMIAGHIVFEPMEADDSTMIFLHPGGNYKHHGNHNLQMQYEAGCQTAFTPYSAIDMNQFALLSCRQILSWLETMPRIPSALRWNIETLKMEVMAHA